MKNWSPCANRAGLATRRNHRRRPLPATGSRLWTSRLDGAATRLRSRYPRPSTSVFQRWRKQSTPIRGPVGVFLFPSSRSRSSHQAVSAAGLAENARNTRQAPIAMGQGGQTPWLRTPSFDHNQLFRALSAFRMRVSNGPVLHQHGSADGSGMPFAQWSVPGVRRGERDPGPIQTGGRLPPEGYCRTPNFNLNNSNKLK